MKTLQLVEKIKSEGQDFEWYPTTKEIIASIKGDLENVVSGDFFSVLDVGAGDGRVLMDLTDGKRYAIEKSTVLIDAMPKEVFVVGTDFMCQTILDKQVDVIFSNPPYSQYEEWSEKIIREANAKAIYLVIPVRWQQSSSLKNIIEARNLKVKILKTCDFFDADRAARAVVHVLRIAASYRGDIDDTYRMKDPFELWFESNFKISAAKDTYTRHEIESIAKESAKEKIENTLVAGCDVVQVLERLYHADLEKLISNYRKLEEIDKELFSELNVDFASMRETLKLKISGLKSAYWRELFGNLRQVTSRLTSSSRAIILDALKSNTSIDFSEANVRAVLIWVLKNANQYIDSQLIEIVEKMTKKANVVLYKSNQRTFGEEKWRYGRKPEDLTHYALDYRIILEGVGGLCSRFGRTDIKEEGAKLINDLMAVAGNLGFDASENPTPESLEWDSKGKSFYFRDLATGKDVVLFEVRAFFNGNMHFKFNQRFILRLNTEFGRLKGWLRDWGVAAQEMAVGEGDILDAWMSNRKLTEGVLKLGCAR